MSFAYDFDSQLAMSHGVSESKSIVQVLSENIPGATAVEKAEQSDDRQGTDWWVKTESGRWLSVDLKARSEDYATRGEDDLALETWSVVEKKIVGWTRRTDKRTDFVLWFWKDTGRWCLVPFAMLCKVFEDKWPEWTVKYKVAQQFTPSGVGYHSECVFVPRREVWKEIYRVYGGQPIERVL